ncbi:MAG: aminoacyl-tRNA hydrolase [Bacteroidota bacterium]
MKYLLVGLGNMGAEYDDTRHNIGFDVIDYLRKEFDLSYRNAHLGDVAEFKFKGRTFVVLKPSTFMNLSGKAVRYWMQKHKIQQSNVLIILDDLNLPFGKQRIKGKGSDGGHNGLKDINRMLGNTNYARLRIGIGNDYHKGQQANFVLGKWSLEELEALPEIIKTAAETAKAFGTIGLKFTMNQFNKK